MKKAVLVFAVIFLVSFTEPFQNNPFRQLDQLTGGTWVMKTKKGITCERWQKAGDNKFTSKAFKVTGSDTAWLEQVELVKKGEEINYVSLVKEQNGGKSVPFKLIESKDNQFVFANPEHDFPQRIVYQFVGKDSLHAWIEGKYNGKEGRSDFYYSRVR